MLEALKAAVEERMRLARSATPWKPDREIRYGDFGWYVYGAPGGEFEDTPQGRTDARYYAANDPAFVLRQCQRDLKVLERHRRETFGDSDLPELLEVERDEPWCRVCRCSGWPCAEIRELAEVYQINLGVSE